MPHSSIGIHIHEPVPTTIATRGRTKIQVVRGRGRGAAEERGKGKAAASSSWSQYHEEIKEEETPMMSSLKLHRPLRLHTTNIIPKQVINYMKRASRVKKERYEDPFQFVKNVADHRFWSDFQAEFYETVILTKKKSITPMQWIDWDYMANKNDLTFNEVISACDHKRIKSILGLRYDWSEKVIAQFYATLWYDREENKSMFWTIKGEKYEISYQAFAHVFGFDIRDTQKTKIHIENQFSAEDMDFMYSNHGRVVHGMVTGLSPL